MVGIHGGGGLAWHLLDEQIERLPIGRVVGVQVAQQSEELLTLEGTAAVEVESLHPGVNLQGRPSHSVLHGGG